MEQWFVAFLVHRGLMRPARTAAGYCRAMWKGQARTWFDLKLRYLAGVPLATVQDWASECWETAVERRVFSGMRYLAAGLQEGGVHLVLLSGAPSFLAQPLATHFGIEECLCAEPAVVDGVLTGGLVRPHPRGRRKVETAVRWLVSHGLSPAQACAVGDHWDDRFLLSFVAQAVVVAPGPRLALLARRHGWPVIRQPGDKHQAAKIIQHLFRVIPHSCG
ncbi:MAG: HAD-IB family phosphatase [candidate division KSB1 bacterium]|nr:HAD-IB family phosphatase [candidate division KSB1 bacterium]MDZ7295153.1 HAD-IB family phosphatase [candidate division KSB1 bacterium]MDZ7377996.1 HAD-IB family phosphatase [candidate division KSB1 bacterium]MDZ7386400.1 HAD-IB family phosphatase [candidate division KSB1 bacterium]MDZ7394037.1 HAD-IB family phosphatase [candidate division KSB1 bacterium]